MTVSWLFMAYTWVRSVVMTGSWLRSAAYQKQQKMKVYDLSFKRICNMRGFTKEKGQKRHFKTTMFSCPSIVGYGQTGFQCYVFLHSSSMFLHNWSKKKPPLVQNIIEVHHVMLPPTSPSYPFRRIFSLRNFTIDGQFSVLPVPTHHVIFRKGHFAGKFDDEAGRFLLIIQVCILNL